MVTFEEISTELFKALNDNTSIIEGLLVRENKRYNQINKESKIIERIINQLEKITDELIIFDARLKALEDEK